MAIDLSQYVAAGYLLSRLGTEVDCTGVRLRPTSLAADHGQRCFFPDAWALSWTQVERAERLREAAMFGVGEDALDALVAEVDRRFEREFGAWSTWYRLEDARAFASRWLSGAPELRLWGVGLHRGLVETWRETFVELRQPGSAPVGASGVRTSIEGRGERLAPGGVPLGHELLVEDLGCCFNSPESLHFDELALLEACGVHPNAHGLLDEFDEAVRCCRHLEASEPESPRFLPWLVVEYPL